MTTTNRIHTYYDPAADDEGHHPLFDSSHDIDPRTVLIHHLVGDWYHQVTRASNVTAPWWRPILRRYDSHVHQGQAIAALDLIAGLLGLDGNYVFQVLEAGIPVTWDARNSLVVGQLVDAAAARPDELHLDLFMLQTP